MPHGLQIWDSGGNLTLDTSTRVFQVMGTITTSAGSGSVAVGGGIQGQFVYFTRPTFVNTNPERQSVHPIISFSSGVLSWAFPAIPHWPNALFVNIPAVVYWGYY